MHYHHQVKSSEVEEQFPNPGLWVALNSQSHGQQCAEPRHGIKCTSVCACHIAVLVIHSAIRELSLQEMF